jgi:hypothetical protein
MRIYNNVGSLLDKTGQNPFVIGLDGLPVPPKIDVIGERLEAPDLVFQIRHPSVTDVPGNEALNFGLLSAIQRRGVTPLVTLKNFSGDTRWKSRSTVRFKSSVWRAALR